MEKFTCKGLITKTQKVGESDRLVTVLTENRGVIKAFAPGAMNIKSKRNAATQLMCYGVFTFSEKSEIYRITEAESIETFDELRNSIEALCIAEYLSEITTFLCSGEDVSEPYLKLILNVLYFICKNKYDYKIIKSVCEIKLAIYAGYEPNIKFCRVCDNRIENEFLFDIHEGVALCNEHGGGVPGIFVSMGVAKALNYIIDSPLEKAFGFRISENGLKSLNNITEKYIIERCEREFTTLNFYKQICET